MHDYPSKIFELIKDQCKYSDTLSIDYELLRKQILMRGFTETELEETIATYLNINLIMRTGNTITLV